MTDGHVTGEGAAPEALYRLPVRLLGDLVSPRALERLLQDAAQSRRLTLETLGAADLEDILKREVFRRLQLSVPAALAKRRVSDVIGELLSAAPAAGGGAPVLGLLEDGVRRFSLYFDWPEAQRLRGVLGVARQQQENGQDTAPLVREGQDLIALMERRLEEGLVAQAQDFAELQAASARVQGMGGKDVRRLESLLAQIEEAQGQGVLLPAEVERARTITFTLRKLLESSVVQPLAPGAEPPPLDPEAQARVLALEQEHVARQLADLTREFGPLTHARPELESRARSLREEQAAGTLTAGAVEAWRAELEAERGVLLASQRADLVGLEARLTALPESSSSQEARVALDVLRLTLGGGGLATDELRDLHGMLAALEAAPEATSRLLEAQRGLAEVERSARDVPGAGAELAPLLAAARETLERGEDVNLETLWHSLERRMGEAAQERQDFDVRADHVVREYDAVRHLAGETIQKLGRLAETLRAQRRLGAMSGDARGRYARSLEEAEALLAESQAEYQAAQEVTASFGADALSGLLGVFDLGDTGEGAGDLFGTQTQTVPDTPDLPDDTWLIRGSAVLAGPADLAVSGVAALLNQAALLGARSLHFEDERAAWVARRDGAGGWRLARGPSASSVEDRVGGWLRTGEGR